MSVLVPGTVKHEPINLGKDIKQVTGNEGHRMDLGNAGSSQHKSSTATDTKATAPKNRIPLRHVEEPTISIIMDNNSTKEPENAERSKKRKKDESESVYEPTDEEEGAEEVIQATKSIQTEANKIEGKFEA